MRFAEVQRRLERRLGQPLPGPAAQIRLAPRPRRGWSIGHLPEGLRRGAGLLLLYPRGGEATLVLTVRDAGLPHHPGQVSFPGGAVEPGETDVEAALREAREEIALDAAAVRVLGVLTPLHIPVSGFALHPVVAAAQSRPRMQPQAGEVARLLEVSLDTLADPRRLEVQEQLRDGRPRQVPYFSLEGVRVWGATAMVLAELLSLLDLTPGEDDPGAPGPAQRRE